MLAPKQTIHLGVEGRRDQKFVEHLSQKSNLVSNPDFGHALRTSISFGRSAIQVVQVVAFEHADLKLALIDCDRLTASPREKSEAIKLAKANQVEVVILKPCLDSILLAITGDLSELSAPDCESAKRKIQAILNPRFAPNIGFAKLLESKVSVRKLGACRSLDPGLDRLLEVFGL